MIQAKCWLATSQFRASQENNTLSAKTCVCTALWKMLQTLEPRYGIPSQRGFSTEREEAVPEPVGDKAQEESDITEQDDRPTPCHTSQDEEAVWANRLAWSHL